MFCVVQIFYLSDHISFLRYFGFSSQKIIIIAPSQQHATGFAVYLALFIYMLETEYFRQLL